ncbi:hypothetical protein [Aquimarina spongiae]|uniref:Uncharacterized protein n=1 Tax=Aquimarina spongiae TaxID=570521 RepID=A0A1M6I1Q7_9FLAO|nr:hypothetical protein [Aquimarina spongiae]SHJ28164.1 hypothetical protein SAMN04488508_10748 [Aquimarina spongiae]
MIKKEHKFLKTPNKNSNSIFDLLEMTGKVGEFLVYLVPYLILTSIGTLIKMTFLTLISLATFNQWIKLKNLWNRKYISSQIGNP